MSAPALAFAIRGEGSETLEIDVYDTIGETWYGEGVSAKRVRAALKGAKNATTIKLRVNSRGGDVFDGFAIYNLLAEHPARVEADIDALAASMASVIVMAADEIRIASNAMVMIHNPWTFAMGEAEDLRGTAELLDKLRGQIADAYVARTGVALERVVEMMDAETWLTAAEALEHGFVDSVKPAKSKGPAEARALAALDLRGFDRAPAMFAAAIAKARATVGGPRQTLPQQQEDTMDENERALRARLGLPESATNAEVARAMQAHFAQLQEAEAPRAALIKRLGLAQDASVSVVLGSALAHIAKAEKAAHEEAVERELATARAAGKITPASVEHYRAMCADAAGLERVRALFGTLAPIVADDSRRDDDPPGPKGTLAPQQRAIAKSMGISDEEYLAALNLSD